MNETIKKIEKEYLSERTIDFGIGDTVNVSIKVREGDKERIQSFQGTVIQIAGRGLTKSFTVRKPSPGNVYVEKIFPLHSPMLSEIKCVRRGSVRRAKLYYLRKMSGKSARIKEKK